MPVAPSPLSIGLNIAETGGTLIMGLLAAHDKRVKAAKEENAAVNQAVSAMYSDLKTIFDALNEGDVTEAVAMTALSDVHLWYWQFVTPFAQGSTRGPLAPFPDPKGFATHVWNGKQVPGQPSGTINPACQCSGKDCTAGCCIGCQVVDPSLSNAYYTVKKGGGSFTTAPVIANKYGLVGVNPTTFTYKKPKVENPEAEVAINVKSGIVTVGAPPSNNDAVIVTGVVSKTATPDTGGDVIQHNAAGADVNTTTAPGLSGIVASIPGGMLTVIVAGFALVLLALKERT